MEREQPKAAPTEAPEILKWLRDLRRKAKRHEAKRQGRGLKPYQLTHAHIDILQGPLAVYDAPMPKDAILAKLPKPFLLVRDDWIGLEYEGEIQYVAKIDDKGDTSTLGVVYSSIEGPFPDITCWDDLERQICEFHEFVLALGCVNTGVDSPIYKDVHVMA